ncbi:MAG: TolC family protein [Gemmatimonadales bacterium]|nr:TolC family protein [Gemmatimonadales bacterium]
MFLTVVGVARAGAQIPGDPYAELVREGLAANRGILQARLGVAQRDAEVRRARGALLPTLDVDARWSEYDGIPDLGDFVNPAYAALNQLTGTTRFPTDVSFPLVFQQDMRLRAQLPLFAPEAYANLALQRALREAEAGRVGAAERSLAAGVQLAALRVSAADRAIGIYREALALLAENRRVSERLVAAGTATPDAVARTRADESAAEQQLAAAERERNDAERALNELLRRPLDTPAPLVADSLLGRAPRAEPSAIIGVATDTREEVRAARALERAAQAQYRLAGSSFLPTVALAGDYGFLGNELRFTPDNDFWIVSVVLRWNLFRGGQDASRRDLATLERERTALATEETEVRVEREVRAALDAVEVAERSIRSADDRLVAARRTFELVTRRYEEGLAPHLEVSDARTQYTTAALNAALTRYALAGRQVELERATGVREMGERDASE